MSSAAHTTPRRSPYQGLVPYTEADAPYFFGRERETRLIAANLFASPLTLLYGASGVGKSSVLRAGVAEHLRGRDDVLFTVFGAWPGDARANLRAHVAAAAAKIDADFTAPGDAGLSEYFEACAEKLGRRLMIVLDQFEEYFLYHAHDDDFDKELARAVTRSDARSASFLISIREDALAKLDRFEGRVPNLFDNFLRVEHLTRAAAREAVVKPVERFDESIAKGDAAHEIEPALVEAVLDQVEAGRVLLGDTGRGAAADKVAGGERTDGAAERVETPYLQLVLTRLWDEEAREGSRVLRLATLERLGGARNIVRTHLDTTMGALAGDEQETAAKGFRYLVTPSGTKIAYTSADLAQFAEVEESLLTPVLKKLSGGARILRLVSPPADTPDAPPRYEIFHDALARPVLDWRARHIAALKQLADRKRTQRIWLKVIAGLIVFGLSLIGAVSLLSFWRVSEARRQAEDVEKWAKKEIQDSEVTGLAVVANFAKLTSDDLEAKEYAKSEFVKLAAEGQLSQDLVKSVQAIIIDREGAEAGRTFERQLAAAVAVSQPAPAPTAAVAESSPPRVFIHIADESQRQVIQSLEATLEKNGFDVPSIEKVGVKRSPAVTELRYFRRGEQEQAKRIALLLWNEGRVGAEPTLVPGFEDSKVVKPNHFELWAGRPKDEADKAETVVVLGNFKGREQAEERVNLLRAKGVTDVQVEMKGTAAAAGASSQDAWRVTTGPKTAGEAKRLAEKLTPIVPDAYPRSINKP